MSESDTWKNKGNTEYSKQNYSEAVKSYTKAIELDKANNPALYTNRAAAYAGLRDWERSFNDAAKSVQIKDDWVKGHFRKGIAAMELKRYSEAVQAFRRAAVLDPTNEDLNAKLKEAERAEVKNRPKVNADGSALSPAQLAKEEGNEAFRLGKINEALTAYTRALGLCTDQEIAEKSNIFSNRAQCYVQLYEPHKVVSDCSEAIVLNSMNLKAYLRRGLAYESLDKMRSALEDFRKVMSLDPSNKVAVQACSRITNALKAQGKSVA
jgi:stress-induced-phosphoprotein 1